MAHEYTIKVFYDGSCGVFVGTSNDIPGLTIEAETRQEFIESAMKIVPILLLDNLKIDVNKEAVEVLIMEYADNKPKTNQDHGLTYSSWQDNPHFEQAYA